MRKVASIPAQRGSGRTCVPTDTSSDGVNYVSCAGTAYISLHYHRSPSDTRRPKSIWAVSRDDECHTFCTAEVEVWRDEKGNYWATSPDAAVVLGTRGERLAFFGTRTNQTDPYHGYPVSGRRGSAARNRPPDRVVRRWLDEKHISHVTYQRILTGRL